MSDHPTIERREILEERGNRDAFRLCLVLAALLGLLLVVLGIFACHTSIVVVVPASPSLSSPPAGRALRMSANLEKPRPAAAPAGQNPGRTSGSAPL